MSKFIEKRIRSFKHFMERRAFQLTVIVLLLFSGTVGYAYYMSNQRLSVNRKTYIPLLSLIAKVESNDNYNAYFGHPRNSEINFTDMTVADVMEWQKGYVARGNPSSAVGRYQIINTTLNGLVRDLGMDVNQKFDQATQDKMAIALLERRGGESYVNQELTPKEYAANLAKEWAALPKLIGDNPGNSYYDGDELNASRVKPDEVLNAIKPISAE